tara:strand:+ start:486 stop:728 length:243 start_codon:yes stop_codon:yes gene_type:complete
MDPVIEIEILDSLDMGNGRLMPERVICADVRRALGDDITDSTVKENIKTLDDLNEIESSNDRDLGKRWRLTAEGKLRLRK